MVEMKKLLDAALFECKKNKIMVDVFLMNGFKMAGCVMDYDDDIVALWCDGKQKIIYKQAISTIVPELPLDAIKR